MTDQQNPFSNMPEPPAAPDPQTVIAAPDEPGTAPKDAGIVSTVDIQETVVIDEQPPLPPAG